MRPRRYPECNETLVLDAEGATEDSDLWVQHGYNTNGHHLWVSHWVLTDEERKRIAEGENIDLIIWGEGHPPVAMEVNRRTLGRGAPSPQ